MVTIPGLPPQLATVPPAPYAPEDPEADEKRRAWRVWRYDLQIRRTELHRDLHADPGLIPFERAKCATHPAYWAAMWLRVFEPRWRVDPTMPIPDDLDADDPDAERMVGAKRIVVPSVPLITRRNLRTVDASGEDVDPATAPIFGYVPFICFADQVRVINELLWSLHQTDEHADVVWSKSRGWGASWILCLLGLWGWTFSHDWPGSPPWNPLYLSRKEEYVDSKQQKSLFWKIRRMMRDMPEWQMPPGWDPNQHDQKGVILNPFNGNEIGGESTNSNAGRGDRRTFAVPDEAAAIPEFMNTWDTLAETTDHRWATSTESFAQGSDFYDLQHDDEQEFKPWRIETDWHQNPLNDDAWLVRTEKRYGSHDIFMQEVWRKPATGSTWVYPWAANIVYDDTIKPVSGLVTYVGADPGFRDPTALVLVQDPANGDYNVLDAFQLNGQIADFFAPLLKPSLFTDVDPNWRDKGFITWTSPLDPTLSFDYDDRALTFARSVDACGGIKEVIGDTYGEVFVGSSNDSIYSRWRRYDLRVNTDRKTGYEVTPSVKRDRTDLGRQKAMDMLSNRWKFADTPGARMAGNAWKNARWKAPSERSAQREPMKPEHDGTSHLRTAGEFLAICFQRRRRTIGKKAPKRATATLGGQIKNMGAMRNSGARATLRGAAD